MRCALAKQSGPCELTTTVRPSSADSCTDIVDLELVLEACASVALPLSLLEWTHTAAHQKVRFDGIATPSYLLCANLSILCHFGGEGLRVLKYIPSRTPSTRKWQGPAPAGGTCRHRGRRCCQAGGAGRGCAEMRCARKGTAARVRCPGPGLHRWK